MKGTEKERLLHKEFGNDWENVSVELTDAFLNGLAEGIELMKRDKLCQSAENVLEKWSEAWGTGHKTDIASFNRAIYELEQTLNQNK